MFRTSATATVAVYYASQTPGAHIREAAHGPAPGPTCSARLKYPNIDIGRSRETEATDYVPKPQNRRKPAHVVRNALFARHSIQPETSLRTINPNQLTRWKTRRQNMRSNMLHELRYTRLQRMYVGRPERVLPRKTITNRTRRTKSMSLRRTIKHPPSNNKLAYTSIFRWDVYKCCHSRGGVLAPIFDAMHSCPRAAISGSNRP